jgi:hypothetical protein
MGFTTTPTKVLADENYGTVTWLDSKGGEHIKDSSP